MYRTVTNVSSSRFPSLSDSQEFVSTVSIPSAEITFSPGADAAMGAIEATKVMAAVEVPEGHKDDKDDKDDKGDTAYCADTEKNTAPAPLPRSSRRRWSRADVLSTMTQIPQITLSSGSEKRVILDLARIIDQSGDGVIAFDEEWRFTYVNDNAAALLSRDEQSLLGECVWKVFPRWIDDNAGELMLRAVQDNCAVTFELHVPLPERWFGCRCLPDTDGPGTIMLFRDITERKISEAARIAAETERERMRALLNEAQEVARVGSWEFDLATDRLTWSDQMYRLCNFPADAGEPDLNTVRARYHPEDAPGYNAQLARARLTGAAFDYDMRFFVGDGTLRWFHLRGRGVRDAENGEVSRLVGTAMDITDRKRAEERLLRSEARLFSLIENFQPAVLVEDENRHVVLANAAFCQLFNIPVAPELLIGMNMSGRAEESKHLFADPARFVEGVDHTLHGKMVVMGEAMELADGRRLERDFVPISLNETYSGHMWLYRDVTERYDRETRLRATADELRRSNAALEEFAYIASHDLKEPLRKIQTFGDLLRRKIGDTLPTDARGYLDRMSASAVRMQGLIDGLLAYSRASRKVEAPGAVALREVVRGVLGDLEARLGETGGRVEVGELPSVLADPLPMRQLFQNLIGNALKFNRPGTPSLVRVWSETDPSCPGWGCIHVEDNGIGFEPDQAERIFGLFERLEGRSQYEGTGVGLAICRKIVERHGGTLTATATPGVGATFTFCLPTTAPPAA